METKETTTPEPTNKSYQPFLKSLSIEENSPADLAEAKSKMDHLNQEFQRLLGLDLSIEEKRSEIKEKFSEKTDQNKLNKYLTSLSSSELNQLFQVALLGKFLWEQQGFIHEDIYLLEKFGNNLDARSDYYTKGQNNLAKTLKSKIGDCNRLGTIALTLALTHKIPLKPYFCEAHFSTAIEVNKQVIQLDTGDGKLYFADDFKAEFPYKGSEGQFKLGNEDDIYSENLRDEFIAIIEKPTINGESLVRLKKIGDEMLRQELSPKYRKIIEFVYKKLKIPIKTLSQKIEELESDQEIRDKLISYIESNCSDPLQLEIMRDSINDFKFLFEQAFTVYLDLNPGKTVDDFLENL